MYLHANNLSSRASSHHTWSWSVHEDSVFSWTKIIFSKSRIVSSCCCLQTHVIFWAGAASLSARSNSNAECIQIVFVLNPYNNVFNWFYWHNSTSISCANSINCTMETKQIFSFLFACIVGRGSPVHRSWSSSSCSVPSYPNIIVQIQNKKNMMMMIKKVKFVTSSKNK